MALKLACPALLKTLLYLKTVHLWGGCAKSWSVSLGWSVCTPWPAYLHSKHPTLPGAAESIIHPDFQFGLDFTNDVAVLLLKSPVDSTTVNLNTERELAEGNAVKQAPITMPSSRMALFLRA